MKIETNPLGSTASSQARKALAHNDASVQPQADGIESGSDNVQLSVDQQKVQALKAKLKALPEMRWDRVNALRDKIRDGSYQVGNQHIADAMMAELF